MRVAFLHTESIGENPMLQRDVARKMVASVRKACSDPHIIQMTDMETPGVDGVDEMRRLDIRTPYLMIYKLRHLTRLDGEALVLDTDIIVLKDPAKVFTLPFDMAFTKRDKKIISSSTGYKLEDPDMPYNVGVVFSRSQQFWEDALTVCERLDDRHKAWFGDQIAVDAIIETRKYNIALLPCFSWNYTPQEEDENMTGRNILHFKGRRKEWMLRWAA